MSAPRLGIYCPGTGSGGPWRYVHSVLAGLDPAEFAVTLFCDLPGDYPGRPDIRVARPVDASPAAAAGVAPDVPAAAQPAGRPPGGAKVALGYARLARRLARRFRRDPVDLLHTQNTGCEESPIAARLAGIPAVLGTFHVDSTYDLHGERSGPAYRLVEQVSNRCLGTAIAVSHATRRDWVRRTHVPAGRVVTIHNGIDAAKFARRQSAPAARATLGLPASGPVVACVGRLDEVKGFATLLHAAARLKAAHPDLTLLIAGTGPLRGELERSAGELGVRANFAGFLTDVQPVLDAADVFALPSLAETLGYAFLEAMAAGLPCVGTAVGGVPEVIAEGRTGFVVPPRDPAALAAALGRLLGDADLRARMGEAGRVRVAERFHERDMVRRTIDLYHRLTPSRSQNADS